MTKKITLDNGTRIVMEPMPYLRSVALGVWALTGSRDETPENSGISHFIEHMFFKGTATRTALDIADEMDKVGGQMNAYTSKELTCYYARVLDSHFDIALDVLADMCHNSIFDEAEIEKEKNVILEEINMYEDTPEDLVYDILQSAVWADNPLGRPVLGIKDTVNGFKRGDFLSYMETNYRPENILISVAGKFDPDEAAEKINARFGQKAAGPPPPLTGPKPAYTPASVMREKDVEQLHLCLAFPGIPLGSEESYTLTLLNTFFGGGMSSRLFQNIREKRGLVYSIYSYPSSYRDTGLYSIYAALNPGAAETVASLIKDEIKNLFDNRMTAETLANTKEQLKSNFMLGLENTSNRMSSNARSELLLNRILTPDEIVNRIDAITLERVYALASSIFDMDRQSISAVGKLSKLDGLFKRGAAL